MAIVEVLCREIREPEIKIINASSNDAPTGGGARDLRFTLDYAPCLDRFFPSKITYERGKPYRIGCFEHCYKDGTRRCENLKYAFRPTDSRPNEVRIAQINKADLFHDVPEIGSGDGMLFIAFIRNAEGIPQVQYLTERQIEDPSSNSVIASAMREAIDSRRGDNAVTFSVKLG